MNLPGAPDGAAYDGDKVMSAIVTGRKRLPKADGRVYHAFVDMSGGSSDDAVLAIAHRDDSAAVLDVLMSQTGSPPFNPRDAIRKFVAELKAWGISRVTGDAYAGLTFRQDFEAAGVSYALSQKSASEIYDAFEPKLNAGEVELLDDGKLQEQLLTLVIKSGKITHLPGDHDDHANAACGAIVLASAVEPEFKIVVPVIIGKEEARSSVPDSPFYVSGDVSAAYRDNRQQGFSRRAVF